MNWHKTYLNIAKEIAQHSKDRDRKVGCIVVKDGRIISTGYNGTPHGFDNNCKDANGKTKKEVIHAESNAITKCARSTESIAGATMYSTLSCCIECAKLIIQCDIKEFYYDEPWKDYSGLALLRKAGIKVYNFVEQKELTEADRKALEDEFNKYGTNPHQMLLPR